MRNINVHAHTFDMVYCKLVCVRYSACTIFIVSTCKLKKTVRLLIVFVAAVVVLCWLLRVLRGMIAMSPIQESGGFLGRRSDWWRFQRCWRTLSNTFTQLARYEILYQISFYSYRRPLTTSAAASICRNMALFNLFADVTFRENKLILITGPDFIHSYFPRCKPQDWNSVSCAHT